MNKFRVVEFLLIENGWQVTEAAGIDFLDTTTTIKEKAVIRQGSVLISFELAYLKSLQAAINQVLGEQHEQTNNNN